VSHIKYESYKTLYCFADTMGISQYKLNKKRRTLCDLWYWRRGVV